LQALAETLHFQLSQQMAVVAVEVITHQPILMQMDMLAVLVVAVVQQKHQVSAEQAVQAILQQLHQHKDMLAAMGLIVVHQRLITVAVVAAVVKWAPQLLLVKVLVLAVMVSHLQSQAHP
jgi:hypothetical protein